MPRRAGDGVERRAEGRDGEGQGEQRVGDDDDERARRARARGRDCARRGRRRATARRRARRDRRRRGRRARRAASGASGRGAGRADDERRERAQGARRLRRSRGWLQRRAQKPGWREDARRGRSTPSSSTARSGAAKPSSASDEDEPSAAARAMPRVAPARLRAARGSTRSGRRRGAHEDDGGAEGDLDQRQLDRGAEIEIEADGGIDRDLEGLDGGPPPSSRTMGKLVKARRKMMAPRPGRVPRMAGQSRTAKRVQGVEREALAGLQARCRGWRRGGRAGCGRRRRRRG